MFSWTVLVSSWVYQEFNSVKNKEKLLSIIRHELKGHFPRIFSFTQCQFSQGKRNCIIIRVLFFYLLFKSVIQGYNSANIVSSAYNRVLILYAECHVVLYELYHGETPLGIPGLSCHITTTGCVNNINASQSLLTFTFLVLSHVNTF